MIRKYILWNAHNQQFTVFFMGMKCITTFRSAILKADDRFLKKKKKIIKLLSVTKRKYIENKTGTASHMLHRTSQ